MNRAHELARYIEANRMLLPALKGKHPEIVTIFGSGPSATQIDQFYTLRGRNEAFIFLNSAVKLAKGCDYPFNGVDAYWLTIENSNFQFPYWHEAQDFTGTVIMERGLPDLMAQMDVDPYATYPREWWERVIAVNRYPREGSDPDIRESQTGTGLSYGTVNGIANGEGYCKNAGGVLWSALHLAAYMGAKRAILYGTELCWPYAGPQHFDGWSPFTPEYAESNGQQTELIRFSIDHPDYYDPREAGLRPRFRRSPDGPVETNLLYLEAAVALQPFIQQCREQGLEVVNQSGGLLDLDLTGALR